MAVRSGGLFWNCRRSRSSELGPGGKPTIDPDFIGGPGNAYGLLFTGGFTELGGWIPGSDSSEEPGSRIVAGSVKN